MSLRRLGLMALVSTSVASSALAAPPLTPDGWGKLRIGMRERDAVRLFHLKIPKSLGADSFDCRMEAIPGQPGAYLMAERGVVTRISIRAPSRLRTDHGLGLGSTEAAVRRAYGPGIKVRTAPYLDEPAHEIDIWNAGGRRGVRYDTNASGRVDAVHVGGRSITYSEGCS